ncbi:MAG: 4-alpha-glucanotransferase [Actinomycetota bacterium]|nr:4-alpha-glucanotransferase [Actinomycetota bacterium]
MTGAPRPPAGGGPLPPAGGGPLPPVPGDLRHLAALYGVETSYVDTAGRTREASTETIRVLLAALGAPVEDPATAVREERLRRHVEVLAPVVAVPAAGTQAVAVGVPRPVHPRDCWLVLEAEDGTTRKARLMPAIHRPLGSASVEGRTMDRYEAQLSAPLDPLDPGYYHLRIEGPGIDAASMVVVAPRCPLPARGWGAFLPVHAMRTRTDWGVGNYPALAEMAAWVRGIGGAFVGTLPLYPGFYDEPLEISPYLPATRLGWNELYVDPTALPELEASPDARDLLGSEAFRQALASQRRNALVDYPASMALVRRVLEPLARALFSKPSARRDALEAFARERPDLVEYSRFRAGAEAQDAGASRATSRATSRLPEDETARYHLYAQWVADQQFAAAAGGILCDLPAGVHPLGFDTSFEPACFAEGVEVGAPPDQFFDRGQRWSFRPLHPRGIREQRYRHVVSVLRHAMRHATVLRLDHVMGLYRLYWVPAGAEATDGAYVRYHDDDLRAIVALEAHRSATAIVGEDLGTVPEELRRGMADDRMLRSWVLQFEVSADAPLPDPPDLSMASIGTHDLPRFVSFWEAPERAGWRRALGGDPRRGLRASLDHLAAGPARLVLADVEDLWLERWPHNRPGSGAEAGNWQHRSARTLEEIFEDDDVVDALARIDALRRQEEAG